MSAAVTSTADLLDEHGDAALVCLIQFRSFGSPSFAGADRDRALR